MRSTDKDSFRIGPTADSRFVTVKGVLPRHNGSREDRPDDQPQKGGFHELFGDQTSGPARTMRAEIERVARRPYNILITGETGTGKTHTAREIHRQSARAKKPFLELNCANLSEQLVEAELFGYRKGAFTGADRDHIGLFEEANGGILLLDEIGDIAPTIQNRLLKAIDEKQIKRLGTNHYVFCDVQIIAATSRNLPTMIHSGEFREDLYCRLAVLTMETTPLRDRREDIPAMVALFLREAAVMEDERNMKAEIYRIEDDALLLLSDVDYPGNIRALRNLIFELTSYINENKPISIQLVQFVLAKLRSQGCNYVSGISAQQLPFTAQWNPATSGVTENQIALECFFRSIARDGDIVLPVELCVLRSDETFKQWTARAKRCSIEAARQATGGSMRRVAERLGLTRCSLLGHLNRAKQNQNQTHFDWER
jgi:DNA-binding NtrC family response regulator